VDSSFVIQEFFVPGRDATVELRAYGHRDASLVLNDEL